MRGIDRFSAGAALFVGCGCAAPAVDAPERLEASTRTSGLHLNGLHLNGIHLNGSYIDGSDLNGMYLDDVTMNDSYIGHIALAGGTLTAVGPSGVVRGLDLAGAIVAATLADGSPLTVRIDAVSPAPASDVLRYAVSYAAPGSDGWDPLCGTVEGSPVLAIPLSGAWDDSEGTATGGARVDDPDLVTFACEGYALAKCVAFGYAPWRRVTECRAPGECRVLRLAPFHQACTRALRADYCGDGTSATRDGTVLDVWDAVGLETDEAPGWPFEAEWKAGGAECVTTTRWPTLEGGGAAVEDYIQARCPERWRRDGCGGPTSTFFVENGFVLQLRRRVLIRTRIVGPM